MANLAKHVGKTVVAAEFCLELTIETAGLELGVFVDEARVFMGRVVLEVGVKAVAPLWPDNEHEPAELVVGQRQDLRDDAALEKCASLIFGEFFKNQQVPLFIVLLNTSDARTVVNTRSTFSRLVPTTIVKAPPARWA